MTTPPFQPPSGKPSGGRPQFPFAPRAPSAPPAAAPGSALPPPPSLPPHAVPPVGVDPNPYPNVYEPDPQQDGGVRFIHHTVDTPTPLYQRLGIIALAGVVAVLALVLVGTFVWTILKPAPPKEGLTPVDMLLIGKTFNNLTAAGQVAMDFSNRRGRQPDNIKELVAAGLTVKTAADGWGVPFMVHDGRIISAGPDKEFNSGDELWWDMLNGVMESDIDVEHEMTTTMGKAIRGPLDKARGVALQVHGLQTESDAMFHAREGMQSMGQYDSDYVAEPTPEPLLQDDPQALYEAAEEARRLSETQKELE